MDRWRSTRVGRGLDNGVGSWRASQRELMIFDRSAPVGVWNPGLERRAPIMAVPFSSSFIVNYYYYYIIIIIAVKDNPFVP